MAYKPYETQKKKIYMLGMMERILKPTNYDSGSVKLFGFRSGAVYKMVPAILYYAFMISIQEQVFTVNLVTINLNQWTM